MLILSLLMNGAFAHSADLELVARSLHGCANSISALQEKHTPWLRRFLFGAGGAAWDVDEIITNLWTDCTVGSAARSALFLKYQGHCQLGHWLKTIALNMLIERRRSRASQRLDPLAEAHTISSSAALPDASLREIMRQAIVFGMSRRTTEEVVILQLVYLGGLTQREVARMWACSDATISRTIEATLRALEHDALKFVKARDGWLKLEWSDFLDMCDGFATGIFS